MDRFAGKVAVVTGCSAGMGAAIVEELVKSGVVVAGLARKRDKLEKLAKKLSFNETNGKFHPIQCDVTVESDIENSFQWIVSNLGPITILINNAGILLLSLLTDVAAEEIAKTFDTNVKAAVLCSKFAIKNMSDNDVKGHIININSLAGHFIVKREPQENIIYTSSKHALKVISEGLRRELVSKNSDIKVTNLSPGLVDTEMVNKFKTPSLTSKNILQPKDIANACIAALSTPPNVLISELTVIPIHQKV